MIDLSGLSWRTNGVVFLIAALVIAWAGTRLAAFADRFADRTGLGEAITGTLFLGVTTSLPGLSASVTAALDGHPSLAISNAIGGIAIQTAFLAIADIFYRRANLEHAAASLVNIIQTALLIALLSLVLLGLTGPDITVVGVHPITGGLLLAAGAGFWLVYRSKADPMWTPRTTGETVQDLPESANLQESLGGLIAGFLFTAVLVTAAGAVVAHTTGNIAEQTGMNETVAGALLSAVATSLPELVTTVASVRRGALTLAVSDIAGGNYLDVMFVFAADLAYRGGSLFHAPGVGRREQFLISLTICLNTVLILGLLFRQRTGPANIGFESALILLLYLAGFGVLNLLL